MKHHYLIMLLSTDWFFPFWAEVGLNIDVMAKERSWRRQKELRLLAQRISTYAQTVRQQFPTGDVVVGERDLAEQLRKRPEKVIIALNLLLNEQKVQRAPLNGYWKLNAWLEFRFLPTRGALTPSNLHRRRHFSRCRCLFVYIVVRLLP
jgi:hypothetical protein